MKKSLSTSKLVNLKLDGPLRDAERIRYIELKKELEDNLDIIATAFVRVGRILRTIRDQRLYRAEYDSFESFCRGFIGKDRRYLNRIIQAEGLINALLEEGVPSTELPSSERLCRELALYPAADAKKIWTKAKQLALVNGKAQPDGMTVREAAVQIEGTPQAKQRAAVELAQKLEGISRSLKISIGWTEMTPREEARVKKALGYIAGQAATLLRSAPAEEKRGEADE
jgi:hypothetical protein